MTTLNAINPYDIPLDEIDVSNPELHYNELVGAYFKRLREEDPVHYCAKSPYGPYWSVTKFQDIMEVDRQNRIFSSEGSIALDEERIKGNNEGDVKIVSFIAMDPPKHDEQRKAVTPAVAPANIALLEIKIRERTQGLLDSLPIDEEFDWVERVSIELTTQMLATLVDFPFEERSRLTRWSDVAVGVPGDGTVDSWEQRNEELAECAAYFFKLRDERGATAEPGADVISMLAHSPAMRNMTDDDYIGNVVLLIVGGNDTTRNSMSGGVLALHEFPEEFAKLKANPALIDSLVPEIIRWQTPIIYQTRRALEDTVLGGKQIRKGDKVAMWYLSGNRDEEAIAQADRFIVDRERPRQHLSFGFGIHRCLGNRLAEMQLRVLWEELLPRFDRIEVVGEVQRAKSNLIRGITSLPVKLHAKA